jgi:retron-type reverse transcriptase
MPAGTISAIFVAAIAARALARYLANRGKTQAPAPSKSAPPATSKSPPRPSSSPPKDPPPSKELADAVHLAVLRRIKEGAQFEAVDVADEVTRSNASRTVAEVRAASLAVEALWADGRVGKLGYERTGGIFHPAGAVVKAVRSIAPAPPPPPRTQPPSAPPPRARVQQVTTGRPPPPAVASPPQADPYEANEILGLSAEALRKRALRINPFRTPWIGRVDTIPPQSDERTAIIDRGLILRGLLTPDQIQEIHRVGDLWLRHHEAVKVATVVAEKSVDRAMEIRRAERAAKREQKRREAAAKREAHAAAVLRRRTEDIIYVGRGVSALLNDRRAHIEELEKNRLPVLASPADVARALDLTIPELRWLSFHAEAAEKTHYTYFEVPKRSGGTRLLAAPHKKLAKAQRWIFQNILARLDVTEHAHGFVRGRSTVTNALRHVGRDVVVNLDLKDFFPSIGFHRVRGLFASLGYSPCAATLLALLCTESRRTAVEHDGKKYWVAVSERALPQGACTSPTISNLVTRKLDRRLAGAARKLGWSYTRYADDLTLSALAALPGNAQPKNVALLLARVRHVVTEEGFRINEKKGRVQRASRRQEVTGVVVNDKPGIRREEVRRIRAILHGAKKTGLAAQNKEGRENFEAWLRGKIAYVAMIDREKGEALRRELEACG